MWSTKKGCWTTRFWSSHVYVSIKTTQVMMRRMRRRKAHLAGVVMFHFPASRQLQLFVGKHVEEGHQVPVVLVALKVVRVPAHLTDHVFQARVGGIHAIGTLAERGQSERSWRSWTESPRDA